MFNLLWFLIYRTNTFLLLNNFASIFELLVGFNAAIILSKFFIKDIIAKLAGIDDEIQIICSEIETKLTVKSDLVEDLLDQELVGRDLEEAKELKKLLTENRIKFEDAKSNEPKDEKDMQDVFRFRSYSFYALIFSFFILLFIGFDAVFFVTKSTLIEVNDNILSEELATTGVQLKPEEKQVTNDEDKPDDTQLQISIWFTIFLIWSFIFSLFARTKDGTFKINGSRFLFLLLWYSLPILISGLLFGCFLTPKFIDLPDVIVFLIKIVVLIFPSIHFLVFSVRIFMFRETLAEAIKNPYTEIIIALDDQGYITRVTNNIKNFTPNSTSAIDSA